MHTLNPGTAAATLEETAWDPVSVSSVDDVSALGSGATLEPDDAATAAPGIAPDVVLERDSTPEDNPDWQDLESEPDSFPPTIPDATPDVTPNCKSESSDDAPGRFR